MARARSIGNVYAELSVKDKMTAGMKRAGKAVDEFASRVKGIGAGLAAALPAAAFAGLATSMKSAIDAGGTLSDMMARTGAEGEGLFVMQRAFENAGIAAEQVPAAINRMQKALATANPGFEKLGLSVSKLMGMDPTAAFRATSEAISKLPDPAQRAAAAMEIFGKSGGQLLVVMQDGAAFSNAAQQVGGLGATLAANAEKLDKVSDSMQLLQLKAQQVGAEIAVELLPQLESMADGLNKIDLGGVTSDAMDFAKALGGIAAQAAKVSSELPVLKQLKGVLQIAEKGIAAVASLNPTDGEALKVDGMPWIGGDPLEKYNEGVMLPKGYTEEIPGLLKRAPQPVAGMTLEESGIPLLAGMLDALIESVTPRALEMPERRPEIERDWRETSYEVNEMQRRGLGMGGETVAREANKQVDLLTQIRDVLKNARIQGKQLVWDV